MSGKALTPSTRLIACCLSLAATMTLLTGCNPVDFEPFCPTLVKYPKEFQARVAKAWPRIPPEARTMLTDYSKLRDACRALGV